MKKIIRLAESDLHRIVKECTIRLIKETYGGKSQISGKYNVYNGEEPMTVVIDTKGPYIKIGDYTLYDDDAFEAIKEIYTIYNEGYASDIEGAIEHYIYDNLR